MSMTIIAHPLDQLLIGSTPAPILSAMMLPGWVWGFLVSTFVEGKSWRNRCNRVRLGAKNYELPSRVKRLHKFKTRVVRQFPFVKTHKNRVSSAKGVHLAEILLPCDKNRKEHKMCARYLKIPDIKFRRELGFGPIVNWFDPAPVLSAMIIPPPIYPTSNENESPTMFSVGFVSVGFWTIHINKFIQLLYNLYSANS